jgi:hypothetical protein
MTEKAPLANLIRDRVEARDEANIPIPKYMLAVIVYGNTREEIDSAIDQLSIDMQIDYRDRDQIDATDGRTSVRLDLTNAQQTPERYAEQLAAWHDRIRHEGEA